MKTKNASGFTLIEIMVILTAIFLIGLTVRSFILGSAKARESANLNQIMTNLRIIEGAKDQLTIQYLREKKEVGGIPATTDLAVYMKDGRCPPKSVVGEVYSLGTISPYKFPPANKATARLSENLGTYPAGHILTAPQ